MRSIDVRNVIAKSKEIEEIQRAHNRVTTTGQQAFEAELSKRAEEESSKVQSPPETQHEKIRSEDKGRGDGAEKGEQDERMSSKGAVGGGGVVGRGDAGDSDKDFSTLPLPGQIIDVEV